MSEDSTSTTTNDINYALYQSLKMKYDAEIQECKSTLLIYFNNPVAIGEHPQHLEEMDKLLEKMANSSDKLEILGKQRKYLLVNTNNQKLKQNTNSDKTNTKQKIIKYVNEMNIEEFNILAALINKDNQDSKSKILKN